jgi:membrane fusion protein, multidrug efflux system
MDDTTRALRETWPRQIERPATNARALPRILAIVVGLGIIAGFAWWLLRPAPAPTASGRASAPTSVSVATVQTGDVDVTVDALGTVTPLATVTIKSQISGQLVRIAFEEGQIVKKGDLLAEIDSRPYELARAVSEGALKRDEAMLHDSELDLERYKKLSVTNAVPKQQLDAQVALVLQNQGNIITDKAQIDTANLNITYCHITAPVNGRVGLRQVDQGNYVTPTDPNGIVIITQLQPITVIFTVAEDNVPAILKQLDAGAPLTVTVYDRSGNTKLAVGKLLTIDNLIDQTTGTLKLRAQFDNADGALFPNQFVNVELLVDVLKGATVAPNSAIQRGAPGTFVYVVNPDNTVSVRPVRLGPSTADNVAITSGLSPGETVVVDGADKLRDGTKINARGTAQEPTTPSASGQGKPGSGRLQSRSKQ